MHTHSIGSANHAVKEGRGLFWERVGRNRVLIDRRALSFHFILVLFLSWHHRVLVSSDSMKKRDFNVSEHGLMWRLIVIEPPSLSSHWFNFCSNQRILTHWINSIFIDEVDNLNLHSKLQHQQFQKPPRFQWLIHVQNSSISPDPGSSVGGVGRTHLLWWWGWGCRGFPPGGLGGPDRRHSRPSAQP